MIVNSKTYSDSEATTVKIVYTLKMKLFFQKKLVTIPHFFTIGLVLFIAAFLRLIKLGSMPLNAHVDEIMNGYVGRFILQNGVDLYGNKWPILYFNNFGDYPNVLPMYLSGASTYLFGVNEFAVRLPIALFGILGVWLVYLIIRQIFQKKAVAVLAASGLAIMPWHIVLSRATAEGITASTVFLLGLLVFFMSIKRKSSPFSLFTIGLWLLCYLLYPSYRVMVPLVLLPTFLLVQTKRQKWIMLAGTLLAFGLTIIISQTVWGKGRFEQTSGFEPLLAAQSTYIAEEGNSNALKARLLFNKPAMLGREFLYQYGTYFSPKFLFAKGGLPMRYIIPDSGVWYYSVLLFVLAGVGVMGYQLQTKKLSQIQDQLFVSAQTQRWFLLLIWILLLSPVAAALTHDHEVPNIHRAALMAPMLTLVLGYPLAVVQQIQWKKISLFIPLVLLMMFETGYFLNQYFVHANSYQLIYRSTEIKNLALYLQQHHQDYDQVYVEKRDEAPTFYFFFTHNFDQSLSHQFQSALQFPHFKNISFDNPECISPYTLNQDISQQHSLFIVRYNCFGKSEPALPDLPQFRQIDSIMSLNPQPIEMMKVYELPATLSGQLQ